jgi:hypothetical protein
MASEIKVGCSESLRQIMARRILKVYLQSAGQQVKYSVEQVSMRYRVKLGRLKSLDCVSGAALGIWYSAESARLRTDPGQNVNEVTIWGSPARCKL